MHYERLQEGCNDVHAELKRPIRYPDKVGQQAQLAWQLNLDGCPKQSWLGLQSGSTCSAA